MDSGVGRNVKPNGDMNQIGERVNLATWLIFSPFLSDSIGAFAQVRPARQAGLGEGPAALLGAGGHSLMSNPTLHIGPRNCVFCAHVDLVCCGVLLAEKSRRTLTINHITISAGRAAVHRTGLRCGVCFCLA